MQCSRAVKLGNVNRNCLMVKNLSSIQETFKGRTSDIAPRNHLPFVSATVSKPLIYLSSAKYCAPHRRCISFWKSAASKEEEKKINEDTKANEEMQAREERLKKK